MGRVKESEGDSGLSCGGETVFKPLVLVFGNKMLSQELTTGKCEDLENSCWAKELVTI